MFKYDLTPGTIEEIWMKNKFLGIVLNRSGFRPYSYGDGFSFSLKEKREVKMKC